MLDHDHTEQRQYARVILRSEITARIEDKNTPPDQKEFHAIGKNIGVEGMLLASKKKLHPGKIVNLKIRFPHESDPIDIKGQIRWCAPIKQDNDKTGWFDTGIKFLGINHAHLRLLVKNVCGNLMDEVISSVN